MKKEIITVDYNRIKELSRPHFDRMCPKAGSEKQRMEQDNIFEKIMGCYDEFLCPKAACAIYEEVCLERGTLVFEEQQISCPGLFPQNSNPEVKSVIVYGISLPDIKPEEHTDFLEIFYLDCWMTALLDGTRDWLKESLKKRIAGAEDKVSDAFGPGFFGIGMDLLPRILEMFDGRNIGIQMFCGSLYPSKTNVGFYLVYKAENDSKIRDCSHCLSGGKNCLFCKNYKREAE